MANPDELIRALCDAAETAAPPGWRKIVVKVWGSVLAYQVEMTVTLADGTSPPVPPPAVTGLLTELRAQMYVPGRGTWFSARFELRAGEPPEAGFNLDQDPAWWPELPPVVFSRDLEAFPRTADHIPGWLRTALDAAAAMQPASNVTNGEQPTG
jgi:hypothetical protein